MAKLQPLPPPRRPKTLTTNVPSVPAPAHPHPPVSEGIDAVTAWVNQVNLAQMSAQDKSRKAAALQTLITSFGRVRSTAKEIELLLRAREQREAVPANVAAQPSPPQDTLALPLWHAFELARLIKLVADAQEIGTDDLAALKKRIRHHVAGVTVRDTSIVDEFKRKHRISNVADAVASFEQVQAQLAQESLTEREAAAAREDLVSYCKFMSSEFTDPWHVQVIADALMRVERGELKGLILNVPPRHGKPVYEDELVLMANGQRKKLKDIQVGERVITHTRRAQVVSEVHIQGDLPCLKIQTKYGRTLSLALSHPVMTTEGWKEAKDIVIGDYIAVSHSGDLECESPFQDAEFLLAGYLLGDGSVGVNQNGRSSGAAFTNADEAIINDFRNASEAMGFQIKKVAKYHYGMSGKSRDYTPRHWLRDREVIGTSYTKTVPAWVFTAPKKQVALYLGAYFSCDGCVEKSGDHGGYALSYNSVSKEILLAVQHLLLRFGIESSLKQKKGKYNNKLHLSWRLMVYGVHNVALHRKHIPIRGKRADKLAACNIKPQFFDAAWLADEVVAVTDAGSLPCRCLTVENDHTFTANDIVVHNSSLASIYFSSWYCGRHPDRDVIVGCMSADFAENNIGGPVRNLIASPEFRQVFPGVNVSPDTAAKGTFRVYNEDGSVRQRKGLFSAMGRGGSPTGRGSNLLILDDFLSETDAYSHTERSKLFDDIFRFRSRLAPDAAWIIINTRYHEDDIVGTVQRRYGSDRQWEVITLPVFAEQDEVWRIQRPVPKTFTRKAGEILWTRWEKDMRSLRETLSKESPQIWSGQYMCRPVPASGALVDIAWFRRYDFVEGPSIRKRAARCVVSVDTGGTKLRALSSSAARTACSVWAEWEDGKVYLLDVRAEPWAYYDMIQAVKDICADWRPDELLIENKAAGQELIADLNEDAQWVRTPITPIDPIGSKETRMSVASPPIRAGHVYVPATGSCRDVLDPSRPPMWVIDYLHEMQHFPMSSRRDQVDTTSQFLNWRREHPLYLTGVSVRPNSDAKAAFLGKLGGPWGRGGGMVRGV